MSILSRYRVVLLDMNGTFVLGHDRLGPREDFHATYAGLGGTRLGPDEVRRAVLSCCDSLARDDENPDRHDDFPSVAEAITAAAPSPPEAELRLLEEVIALHELGRVPDTHAAFLRRLAASNAGTQAHPIWRVLRADLMKWMHENRVQNPVPSSGELGELVSRDFPQG